jgi:hypothetical protein
MIRFLGVTAFSGSLRHHGVPEMIANPARALAGFEIALMGN